MEHAAKKCAISQSRAGRVASLSICNCKTQSDFLYVCARSHKARTSRETTEITEQAVRI